MPVKFTDAEKDILAAYVDRVWSEVAYDCLQATAEEKGKNVDQVTIRRSQVIEISLDASRPEELMRRDLGKPNRFMTQDLFDRWEAASYSQKKAIAGRWFTYASYGT